MANNSKKYASLSSLQTFLDNLKRTFAAMSHKHTVSDITDYEVDTSLSATSTNPVQNKVLDAEFEAMATAMNALETVIDGKADASHNHDSAYAAKIHNHDEVYATVSHNHDSDYDTKGSASAVQANLNTVSDTLGSHTGNADIHVTAANKTNWTAAYTHSISAHARTDATKVEDSTTNGNILINGTEANVYSHPNSGVTAGTYKSVTVNAQGHVTGGSNPTTLTGYGITDAETKTDASAKLTEAKQYADTAATKVKNDLLNNAGTAYDTLKELGDLIDDNTDAIDALETIAASKANASDLTSHTGNKSNPHGVTLSQLGVTATSAELNIMDGVTATASEINKLDGLTATTDELNYVYGVTSNIQAQLDGKAASEHVHPVATNSANGFMSADDKSKLDGIEDYIDTQIEESKIVYVGPDEPTDPNIKVWINTSEEGTGVVPVLPRVATITLAASAWSGSGEPYSQQVEIATVTTASKVDLQPTAQQIVALQNAEISLMVENNGGVITCYAIGNKPTVSYTMQVLIQEVAYV